MSEYTCRVCGKEFEQQNQLNGHMMSHGNRKDVNKPDRTERIPLGVRRLSLQTEKRQGKVGRWINDTGDRVARAIEGGYVHVKERLRVGEGGEDGNENLGSLMSKTVFKDNGDKAYFMEIDEDLYEQDQRAKLEMLNETEKAIQGGKFENQLGEHSYIPTEGIKMGVSK